MNYLLNVAASLINLVLSVIISPLIIVVYAMIFTVTTTRYIKAYNKKMRIARERKKRLSAEPQHYPWNFELVLQKLHVFGYKR